VIALAVACILAFTSPPPPFMWKSAATGKELVAYVLPPTKLAQPVTTVVYLKGLSILRLGREPDQQILSSFLNDGILVLVVNYNGDSSATSPQLNADLLKLRDDIAGKIRTVLEKFPVDPNHLFIIPEGFRLKQNVEFARDGDRVLAMDIIYPADSAKRVPLLMEITCDNQNRMGSGSLLFCHDTLFEGAPLAGFAAAMIDHPVAPPYKGLDDPMPHALDRAKAATKKLRELSEELGHNGKIGVMGFSRGASFAAMLASPSRDDVQAALVHGNRFDYLNLMPNDPMLARFEKAWGPRDAHRDRWAEHGAAHYLTAKAAPMFLNTSDTESAEYRDGLAKLAQRLTGLGVEHRYVIDRDGRGHRVTTDPRTLGEIYGFFHKCLDD
jgi:hypothetical protein